MYKLTNATSVVRLADNATIPFDENNADYKAYQEWVALGNTPSPIPAPSIAELKALKQSQIDAIEAKAYMRRGQREDWLIDKTAQFTEAGYSHDQVYAANPEYKRVYDENVLATQYRAELKAIK